MAMAEAALRHARRRAAKPYTAPPLVTARQASVRLTRYVEWVTQDARALQDATYGLQVQVTKQMRRVAAAADTDDPEAHERAMARVAALRAELEAAWRAAGARDVAGKTDDAMVLVMQHPNAAIRERLEAQWRQMGRHNESRTERLLVSLQEQGIL